MFGSISVFSYPMLLMSILLLYSTSAQDNVTEPQTTLTPSPAPGTNYTETTTSSVSLVDSQYWDCGLTTTHATMKLLKDRTSNSTSLIYLKLNFLYDDSNFTEVDFSDTIRALLKSKSSEDVVDPRTWIWAREGKGTKLLTCSFDFKILSLTTLSLGVMTAPVDIILPFRNDTSSSNTNCFWNSTDEVKLNILAKSIAQLIEGTVPAVNQDSSTAEPGDTVFKVCLERVNPNPNAFYKLLLDAHILRQLSTTYDCWKIVKDTREVGHIIYRDKITTAWLTVLYLIGVLVALFFPVFLMSCFIWKHPPKEIDGKSWISLNTRPLPVGVKYTVLLWQPTNNSSVVTTFRALVAIVILFSIQYIPVLCSLLLDPERFWTHKEALDRTGLLHVSRDYMYVLSDIMCCLIPSILYVVLYNTDNDRGLFRKTFRNNISISVCPCHVTEHVCPGDECDTDIQILYKNIKKNLDTILDPTAWMSAICSWWVLINVPCLILRALPLAYCGLLIGKTAIWCLRNDIFGAIIVLFVLLTFYFFTIKIITVFIYIAQIFAYTYTGIVTNADNLGLLFIIVLLDLFFILTALTVLYDQYYELFLQTVNAAEDICKSRQQTGQKQDPESVTSNRHQTTDAQPLESPMSEHNGRVGVIDSECKIVASSMVTDPVRFQQQDYEIVQYTDRQVPMIETELFLKVVENYKPYRKTIVKVMLRQILPIIIVSICGYQVVKDIGANKTFFSTLNFLSTVALSGAIPAVANILGRSRSEIVCVLESRKRDIRQFVLTYVEEKEQLLEDSTEDASSAQGEDVNEEKNSVQEFQDNGTIDSCNTV